MFAFPLLYLIPHCIFSSELKKTLLKAKGPPKDVVDGIAWLCLAAVVWFVGGGLLPHNGGTSGVSASKGK